MAKLSVAVKDVDVRDCSSRIITRDVILTRAQIEDALKRLNEPDFLPGDIIESIEASSWQLLVIATGVFGPSRVLEGYTPVTNGRSWFQVKSSLFKKVSTMNVCNLRST